MKVTPLLLLPVFLCSTSIAGSDTYECLVESTFHLEEDGMLKSDDVWNEATFSVERKTGEIHGELSNQGWPEKRVIDNGTDLSAYKLVWVSYGVIGNEDANKSGYLEIHEWVDSAVKPFVIVFAMLFKWETLWAISTTNGGDQWVYVTRPQKFWEPRVWDPSKPWEAKSLAASFAPEVFGNVRNVRIVETSRPANQ